MPDGTVEIIYRTKAELQGAQQMQQSLEKTIGQKKALGQEYTKEEAQLNTVKASLVRHQEAVVQNAEAYWKLKKSTEGASDGIDKVGGSLSSMVTPMLSATALATAAISAFSEWNKVLNETALAQQNFAPGANSFSTAARSMQDMVDRATEFNEALRLQESNFGRVEAASGRAIATIQQNTQAQRQALDAEKVLALAKLELRRQTDPNFSQQDFNAARQGLRAGFRQRGKALESGAIDAEIKVKQAEFNEMMKQGRDAEQAKPGLEANLQKARDELRSRSDSAEKDTKVLTAELLKNQQKLAFIDAFRGGASPISITGQPLHKQFGLTNVDLEEMRAAGMSKTDIENRNRQIQSQIKDRIPAQTQAAQTAVTEAQSKLADANRNIAATRPGAIYDAKTGEISSLLTQKGRLSGTLAGSQANLDKAADIRETAATIAEDRETLKADKETKKSLI
jgi:hypothetical protein